MSTNGHRSANETWQRFKRAWAIFFASPEGHRARAWFVLLISLLVAVNGLNVINSYVGRDFISAIEHKNQSGFLRQAWLYAGVFVLSTLVAVFCRFAEERLALLWRDWQTRHVLGRYLTDRVYYQLHEDSDLANPDQRIAEDIRAFTTTTLSFVLMTLNASFTVIAFSGVLWSINPRLFFFAVFYAIAGSSLTFLLGRPLIGLNDRQLDKEADFRSELMHVRENAESLALLNRDERVHARLLRRLFDLVSNARKIISVNRNLGFFTTGYNYFIQIIPALIVAPLFMKGKAEFGVVTQSAMAFAQLMGAFSLIVTQFQSISSYAAVVSRLSRLNDAIDDTCAPQHSPIQVRYEAGRVAFEHLTLKNRTGQVLVHDLNLSIKRGMRVLVAGSSGHSKLALFKATAGLTCDGEGVVVRPPGESIMFLPERPYLPNGKLRELLLRPGSNGSISTDEIMKVLRMLRLEQAVEHAGGLDVELDWNDKLSLSEQALMAVARVLLASPEFVFVDRLSIAMDASQAGHVLAMLERKEVSILMLGKPDDAAMRYDATLTLGRDGAWQWQERS